MTLLKTADEVTAAATKAKKEIAAKGTNGDEEAFKEAVFVMVRPQMAGAKMEHMISGDMRRAIMVTIDSDLAMWDHWERRYKTHYPKNRTTARTRPGARTRVTVDGALQKVLAGGIMKMPKGVITTMTACRIAQNEFVEAALIQSTKSQTRRRSWDKPAAAKARKLMDMSIDHWGAKIINGTRNTKKENR